MTGFRYVLGGNKNEQDFDNFMKNVTDIAEDYYGNFEVVTREEREGRNPKTGEPMKIAASKTPKFKPGKALKDMVNQ